MLIVCVYVCAGAHVFIWQLGMNKNQKKASGGMDDFLTWAVLYYSIEAQENTWTNKVLYVEPSHVHLQHQWYHTLFVQLAAIVYVSF